ncbi:MAG: YchJ family protein [Deltaproteobacteria bacterium]|nr:YchJ family protein [Deltaproteobacteria bacterium]
MASCPCGSGSDEAACCGPYHDGAPAPTALALMQSRYTAYVRGNVEYIVVTHHEPTRQDVDRAAIARWSRDTDWQGLEIVATEHGGEGDAEGMVEFIARGVTAGRPFAQRERSRFVRVDDRWFYAGGKILREPLRAASEPGRNDPCPCGSGMKYKRCHGA